MLIVSYKVPWFFQVRDGPWLPTLRTLHRCARVACCLLLWHQGACFRSADPHIMPKVGVDKGQLRF